MTCILSVPPLYLNQYKENVTNIQYETFQYLDLNLMIYDRQHSGFLENRFFCNKCQVDTDKESSGLSNGMSDTVIQDPNSVFSKNKCFHGTDGNTLEMENQSPKHGENFLMKQPDILIRTNSKQGKLDATKCGVKRKGNTENCVEEVNIPSKRPLQFLVTRKERDDERKNILKISMRKIKVLDDPENFLHRSVLINNLTKRLQTDLRQENQSNRTLKTYKRKCFSDYKVLNNSCLSETYLCDDLFLSGTHEAITDDMTDTLINNVLNDNESKESQWVS